MRDLVLWKGSQRLRYSQSSRGSLRKPKRGMTQPEQTLTKHSIVMAQRLIPATSHYMKVACAKNEHQMPLILTVSEGTVRIKHTCCTSDHSRLTCKFMDQKGRVPTWRDLLLDSFAKDLSRFALTFQFIHVFDCSSLCMWCLSAMHAHNENEIACMLTGRVSVREEEKRKKRLFILF